MEGIIAQRYAVSLFEVSQEFNIQNEILNDVKVVKQIFDDNSEFYKILCVPTINKSEKETLLNNIFNERLNIYTLNFLKILSDKGRINCYDEITSYFIKLYNDKNNIKEIVAVTAIPLSDDLAAKLKTKLCEITGKTIVLKNEVDKSLIGGVMLKIDDNQFDGTVKGRLNSLKKALSSQIA